MRVREEQEEDGAASHRQIITGDHPGEGGGKMEAWVASESGMRVRIKGRGVETDSPRPSPLVLHLYDDA